MPCQVSVQTPLKDKHVTSLMTIAGEATHLFLGMNRAEAALVPQFDAVPAVESVFVGAKNVDAWTEGKSFDWEFDVSNLPTGQWTLVVNAWAAPDSDFPGQAQGSCEARVNIYVDNSCPSDELIAPLNSDAGGNYFQTMPVQVELEDNSGVQSAHLEDESGAILHEFPLTNDGEGMQMLQTVVDICDYGTGVETFHLVVTDELGNTCSHALTPNIIRCPRLARVHTVDVADDLIVRNLVRHDQDGDGRKDIIGATNLGIAVFRNNEAGYLEEPTLIEGIEGPLTMVAPRDVNGDGKSDYIVVGSQSSVAAVRVYLRGTVCQPDPEWIPGTDDVVALAKEEHPVVCADGYGLAQELELGGSDTAHLLHDVAHDPDALSLEPKIDVIVGTDSAAAALVVMLGVEGTNDNAEAGGVPWCHWWQPQWNGLGEELPKPAHAVSKCFRDPMNFPGVPNISSLASADFVEDSTNSPDLIAARAEQGILTVFPNDGLANFQTPYSAWLPGPATNLIPQLFNIDQGGAGNKQHMDVMFAIPSLGQIWTIYGDGKGNWLQAIEEGSGMDYTARRVTCVEGEPSHVMLDYLDELPGQGTATLDMLVTNKLHGTLMMYKGASLNPTTGARFDVSSIVDAMDSPIQVLLNYINDDVYHDAVMLRADGKRIAIAYGADPSKPVTDAQYGPLGSFIGGVHVPTVIPNQPLSSYHVCTRSDQQAGTDQPSLGTPEQRLAPEYMLVGNFVNDGSPERPDLVMVTELSATITGSEELTGDPLVPMLTYQWDNKTQMPSELVQVSALIPQQSICQHDGDVECEEESNGEKGTVLSVTQGNFDFDAGPDIAMVTDTSYASTDDSGAKADFPEYPTLDVMENDGTGLPHLGSFAQHGSPSDSPAVAELDGTWIDLGVAAGSRPVSVAAIHCQGVTSDPLTDLAVLAERETDEYSRAQLSVYQSKGNQYQRMGPIEYFDDGQVGIVVRSALLGPTQQFDNQDKFSDLVALTTGGIYVYEGAPNCLFNRVAQMTTGLGGKWLAVGDLNDDKYAELVVPLNDGSITVAHGIDGKFWSTPVKIKPEDGLSFAQVEIADLNGDGFPDVLAYEKNHNALYTFVNNGWGDVHLAKPFVTALSQGAASFGVKDINGDQCLDLLVLSPVTKAVGIFRNQTTALGVACIHGNKLVP